MYFASVRPQSAAASRLYGTVRYSAVQCGLGPLYTGSLYSLSHQAAASRTPGARRAAAAATFLGVVTTSTTTMAATVSSLLEAVTAPWRTKKQAPAPVKTKKSRKSPRSSTRKRRDSDEDSFSSATTSDTLEDLEIVTPRLSDLQFKYNWNIKHFVDKVQFRRTINNIQRLSSNHFNRAKTAIYEQLCRHKYLQVRHTDEGLNSAPFTISVAGLRTVWSLSVRCWVCEGGVRLHNPVVICLNLLQVSAANRLIGEVIQSRRRPLLGPSPG